MYRYYISFVVLAAVLYREAFCGTRKELTADCITAILPGGVREYQPSLKTTRQIWSYDNLCTTRKTCFGSDDDGVIRPQMVPLELQEKTELWFQTPLSFSPEPQVKMKFHYVNEFGFSTCDTSQGIPLSNLPTNITYVEPDFLTVGKHYFIAFTDNPRYSCHYGLRLNVTVKPYNCSSVVSGPCSKQGRCVTRKTESSFSCKCCPGFGGSYCHMDVGCADEPCLNDAACVQPIDANPDIPYQCLCKAGFVGPHCEHKIATQCDLFPCKHGLCRGNLSHYECTCSAGYSGHNCEINENDCENSPCQNGGLCEDLPSTYICHCKPGFMGPNCESPLAAGCLDQPTGNQCENNGKCVQIDKVTEICHCPGGYTGKVCEQKVNLCDTRGALCSNGGVCEDLGEDFACLCPRGYTGIKCEIDINNCVNHGCLNGGACIDGEDKYSCHCSDKFFGAFCQYTDDPNQHFGEEKPNGSDSPSPNLATSSSSADSPSPAVIVAVFTVAILFAVLVLAILCAIAKVRKRSRKRVDRSTYNRPTPSAAATTSQTRNQRGNGRGGESTESKENSRIVTVSQPPTRYAMTEPHQPA